MHISDHKMRRRQVVAEAQLAMTQAMDAVENQHGEFTVAEWLLILNRIAGRLIAEAVVDERQEKGDQG